MVEQYAPTGVNISQKIYNIVAVKLLRKQKKGKKMEALFNKLHSKFITYDWYKTDRNKEMTKQLKAEIIEILSSQLEAQVSNTNSESREDKIMELLQDFWNDYNNNKAVVWLRNDETKQLAIYTRGEYADELIQFISRLS